MLTCRRKRPALAKSFPVRNLGSQGRFCPARPQLGSAAKADSMAAPEARTPVLPGARAAGANLRSKVADLQQTKVAATDPWQKGRLDPSSRVSDGGAQPRPRPTPSCGGPPQPSTRLPSLPQRTPQRNLGCGTLAAEPPRGRPCSPARAQRMQTYDPRRPICSRPACSSSSRWGSTTGSLPRRRWCRPLPAPAAFAPRSAAASTTAAYAGPCAAATGSPRGSCTRGP